MLVKKTFIVKVFTIEKNIQKFEICWELLAMAGKKFLIPDD